ncbi:MAG: hypothetical protein J6W00_08610 [Lentisphaeria bacterium]|nr:hypothetical protein [Lentisphaeria bacterium]
MTKPLNVTIVILGYADSLFDLDFLRKYKSDVFKVSNICNKRILPIPNNSNGRLDIIYSPNDIAHLLKDVTGDLVVGIIDCPLTQGFFSCKAGQNKYCLSIKKPRFILERANISIENFILKSIYKYILFSKNTNFSSHRDTRRCIFDLNGDLQDIVFNTEKVTICSECKAKLEKLNLPQGYIKLFEKELLHIDKDVMKKVELWLQSHVYIAMLLSGIASLLISILANILYKLFAV